MLKPSRLQAVDPQRTAGLYLTTQSAQTHMRLDIRFLGGGGGSYGIEGLVHSGGGGAIDVCSGFEASCPANGFRISACRLE